MSPYQVPRSHSPRSGLLIVAVMLLGIQGCQNPPTRQDTGMVIGGVLGGALGSTIGGGSGQTVATVIGAIAGAAIGGAVGQSMDETDRLKTAHALETVRTGVPAQWVNPDTRNSYPVVPDRTYEQAGTPCREYTVDAVIGGKKEKTVGTACRQADGSWRVQS
jgi:surface antigen